MSWEAWGDGDDGMDGYVTDEHAAEMAEEAFVRGAQACREMMARFVEATHPEIANSIRLNWHPIWGEDPGKIEGDIPTGAFSDNDA